MHPVKSYLEDNPGFDNSDPAMGKLLQRVRAKPFRHLGDLDIGQPGIGFADVEEFGIGLGSPHRERVIRQNVTPLAVPRIGDVASAVLAARAGGTHCS